MTFESEGFWCDLLVSRFFFRSLDIYLSYFGTRAIFCDGKRAAASSQCVKGLCDPNMQVLALVLAWRLRESVLLSLRSLLVQRVCRGWMTWTSCLNWSTSCFTMSVHLKTVQHRRFWMPLVANISELFWRILSLVGGGVHDSSHSFGLEWRGSVFGSSERIQTVC